GGNSTTPSSGIYKIVNNHLEAAAENIMFGGADPDPQLQIDTDIEVRRNYLYKPQRWNPKSPEYVAESPNPYNVKNCFELKSASRVLVEGNVCDGVWAGFSQKGRAVLLTTKNQPGSVDNVTIRYNLWQRIGGTWEIGNMTFPGYAYTLHDNLFAQVKWSYCYGGCGLYDSQITTDAGSTVNILHDISITHNTVAVDPAVEGMDGVENGTLTIDGPLGQKQSNLAINDNILVAGHYGLWPANGGCANSPSEKSPQGRIASCWSGWRMTGNIIAGGQSISGQLKLWPPGNSQPANQSAIGYTDLLGGDYSLSPDSPYRHTATDGTDPGADMDTLKALTWGVIDKM
ncbi:MAG TPA: hypothetical protein VHM90_11210, partial [Phycisphaerae bacterium]|nr:hypothetical protein [Phycisphaerae bacterium]